GVFRPGLFPGSARPPPILPPARARFRARDQEAAGLLGEAQEGTQFVKLFAIVLAVLIGTGEIAFATEPQVGRWAVDSEHCGGAGDTRHSAPLTVTPTSLRWAEESCTIGKMYKADRALYIEGRCQNGAGLLLR